ncbi:DUF5930 domain-containing protein [Paenirhodobacter sp.]|uniref:DUF5930 domain-containing protein n=1 Tax=Paenirhodobacter sp. TaxID=1965326 RepID=UPI003B4099F4
MPRRLIDRINTSLERWLPEQRLFIKSDTKTRFVRLRPLTQLGALTTGGALFLWAVGASSVLFINHISSGSAREQVAIAQAAFEQRLVALAQERDNRANEAATAQKRFQVALGQVSQMQSQLLASEERRREVETGLDVVQSTLKRTMGERDAARKQIAETGGEDRTASLAARAEDMSHTVDMLSAALGATAAERDAATREAADARLEADRVAQQKRQIEARNDQIFTTLEGAVNISMKPLDRMFRNAGMNPDSVLSQIRKGYAGTGGPLLPIALSSKNMDEFANDSARAQGILDALDQMNMYRIAVDKLPFALPLEGGYRFTSPFGYRWGRLHAGIDLAGPVGMSVKVPADGTVIDAGWANGYGLMIRVQHDFGVSTVYGHLSKIRVKVGQKVSRGERIGDTGNTGRSTGPHLHYEIRVDGKPINPMTFIKAAQNVF